MEYITFSCFDNFVRGNNAGVPDHTPMHYSLQHLEEWVFLLRHNSTEIKCFSKFLYLQAID